MVYLLVAVGLLANACLMAYSGNPDSLGWYPMALALLAWSSIPFITLAGAAWLSSWELPGAATLFITTAVITFGGVQILVDALLVNVDPRSGIVFVVLPVYQSVVAVLGIGVALGSEHLGRRLFSAVRR